MTWRGVRPSKTASAPRSGRTWSRISAAFSASAREPAIRAPFSDVGGVREAGGVARARLHHDLEPQLLRPGSEAGMIAHPPLAVQRCPSGRRRSSRAGLTRSSPSAGRCRRGCGRRRRCRCGRPPARTCAPRSHGAGNAACSRVYGRSQSSAVTARAVCGAFFSGLSCAVGAALLDRADLLADRDHARRRSGRARPSTRSRSARSSACPAPGTTSSARGSRSPSAASRCRRPRCPPLSLNGRHVEDELVGDAARACPCRAPGSAPRGACAM